MIRTRTFIVAAGLFLATVLAAGCGSSDKPGVSPGGGNGAKTFRICPGPIAQTEAILAFFDVQLSAPKDVSLLAMVGGDERVRTAFVEMSDASSRTPARSCNGW